MFEMLSLLIVEPRVKIVLKSGKCGVVCVRYDDCDGGGMSTKTMLKLGRGHCSVKHPLSSISKAFFFQEIE